jgi:hypothetical protein
LLAYVANPYSFTSPVLVVRGPVSHVAYYGRRGFRGLGLEQQPTQQIIAGVTGAAGKAALAIMGPAAAAGPIGLAVGGAMLAITALSGTIAHLISGCGQVCVNDTNIVNQADVLIQQLKAAYWNTNPRTVGFQKWTLQQMDAIFAQVQQNVGLQKSATERLTRGGGAPWCAANNLPIGPDCGGWYDTVYDPIAHDANTIPDPPDTSIGSTIANLGTGAITGSKTGDVALIGGVILLAVILMVAL